MAQFIKKGINKKKGDYIYPEPTQTNTGNCAAYAGASCLYAFGLDHQPGLIPTVVGGTPAEKFQVQMQRMVERLTDLIYTKNNSVADGYKKYIEEKGLSGKFEVTEFKGDDDIELPDGNKKSNWDFALEELKRCQDIIPFVKWDVKGKKKEEARHAVTLVGFDLAKKEAIIANPWGKPNGATNVPPDEAGRNTAAGRTNRAHTKYKFTKNGNKITVQFEGHSAEIYHFVKICPIPQPSALCSLMPPKTLPLPNGSTIERCSYLVKNEDYLPINAIAIRLPDVKASEIVQVHAPKGWSCSMWYRDREPYFDVIAPESKDPDPMTFAGVLWRSEEIKINPGEDACYFSFDLKTPNTDLKSTIIDSNIKEGGLLQPVVKMIDRLGGIVDNINTWTTEAGTAILISETYKGAHSLYVDTNVPTKFCEVGDAIDNLLKSLEPRGSHFFLQPEIIEPGKTIKKTKKKKPE